MQLNFLISLCFISTDFSHAYGNEQSIGLGLCLQPTKHNAKPLSGTQSLSCVTCLEGSEAVKSDIVGHDLVLTHFSDAYVLERYLGLGFFGKPSAITLLVNVLDNCKSKGSVLSTSGQGTDNTKYLVSYHVYGVHLESSVMDLANRSLWEVFLEEDIDMCTDASLNCTRSVSFLGKEDIAHDVDRDGIFVISSHKHMPIGYVVSPLYSIFTYLSHAHANKGIGLGLCRQPMKQIVFCGKPSAITLLVNVLDTCKRKGSVLTTLGQGTDNDNCLLTDHACCFWKIH